MSYSIRLTGPAAKDIKSIITYIKNILQNPQAADTHLSLIEKSLSDLKTMPLKYPVINDEYLSKKDIHCFIVKNYYFFYRIEEQSKTVTIIRVLYARSSWKNILKED